MKDSLNDHQHAPVVGVLSSHTSINNILLLHLLSCLRSLVLIDPVRLEPVVVRNNTKLHLGVGHRADAPEKGGHTMGISRLERGVEV